MILACRAVRRGVTRALVSCDFPFGPLQEGPDAAVRAAIRLVKEGGADLVKLDGASGFPEAYRSHPCGCPGLGPVRDHAADRPPVRWHGENGARARSEMTDQLVADARLLEQAGASLLDFTNSGPVAGPAAVAAVSIPVIGGLGGGPWLDGRVRAVFAAIGYLASALDDGAERYANVANGPRGDHNLCRRRARGSPGQRRSASTQLISPDGDLSKEQRTKRGDGGH